MTEPSQTRVVVTPGDPAGIGPFVMYRAWQQLGTPDEVRFAGPAGLWSNLADRLGGPVPHCLDERSPDTPIPAPGCPDDVGARIAWRALDQAIHCARSCGAAIVTGPISKEHMVAAGFPHAGHTDYLREQFGVPSVLMVMAADAFVVGLATVHVPLASVPDLITPGRIADSLQLLDRYLAHTGADTSRPIAVAGVNPHAGERGTLGNDERRVQAGIERAQQTVSRPIIGPLPGDTVFRDLSQERVSAVLAMYHDQGLAPFKLLHFDRGVNVTVGLPVLRTSPDHGTAFDLAARDTASSDSARAALAMAIRYGARWSTQRSETER
ncbi:MAG: 4-hydroxythreonine-4-phosphate dehydrogenase PdxA [Candidatus Dadabacteria bacterium]|nr:MAG: 4-hydroxythreonine-4-phosphate dehydrogenase PdxA [Candidatus Dadabacteria bacterium]